MNKSELESLCERLSKEISFYKSIISDIKQMLVYASETFKNGLAEETDFNLGAQHTLAVISSIINSKVRKESYLHCPSFRNIVAEETRLRFTIIEGGLSKPNKQTAD